MRQFHTIIFLFTVLTLSAQNSRDSSQNKHRSLVELTDPIDKSKWTTISARVWSKDRAGIKNRRFCADFSFQRKLSQASSNFKMKFVINAAIEEWPLHHVAYAIINNKSYELSLNDVNSKLYYIKDESTSTDASGNTSTTISTRDFQLFKKEVDLSSIIKNIDFVQNFSIVVYSGEIPIHFEFDEADLNRLHAVL